MTAVLDFEEFVQSSYVPMVAKALVLCGSRPDAEDAVQDAYLEAFRRWDRISGYESVEGWIYRVVSQRLWRRSAVASRAAALVTEPVHQPGVESVLDVLDALAALPPAQRVVVVLCCLRGQPQDEVAELLGIRRGTVAAHLFKARAKLRELLADERTRPVGADGQLLPVSTEWLAVVLGRAERMLVALIGPVDPSDLPALPRQGDR